MQILVRQSLSLSGPMNSLTSKFKLELIIITTVLAIFKWTLLSYFTANIFQLTQYQLVWVCFLQIKCRKLLSWYRITSPHHLLLQFPKKQGFSYDVASLRAVSWKPDSHQVQHQSRQEFRNRDRRFSSFLQDYHWYIKCRTTYIQKSYQY